MKSILSKYLTKKNKKKLEFCQNNLDRFFDKEALQLLTPYLSEKSVTFKEYKCLNQCELCRTKPYAIVNGNVVCADTPKELLIKIEQIQ
jgi:uncharacterized protein YuzB (UPF0349 family)